MKNNSTKVSLLVLTTVVFLCSLTTGYFFAQSNAVGVSLLIATLIAFFSYMRVQRINDAIQNRYYWYEQLLDAVPTPLSVTDLDMNWTFINNPVEQLFNKPKKKFHGKPCHHWGAAICQTEKCGVWRLRQGNTETFFSQFDREFRVDTHYLHDLKGQRIGHVEVCTDITALSAVIKAANVEKESKLKVENAYRELQSAQQHLIQSEKMASLGGLVAGIAHEINTPIGICVTASSIVGDEIQKLSSVNIGQVPEADWKTTLDFIVESNDVVTSNLNRAVGLIKSFKQIAVDQSSEACYRFSVAENLNQVVTSLNHELKKKCVSVKLNCSPDLEIHNYPGVFSQIYTNLILNSVVHGFIDQHTCNKIEINVEQKGLFVNIDYADNGCGIHEEIVDKVFEPFVTTNRGGGGSGLGTSIIYNLVTHKLKGKISCYNTPGHGCRFTIEVPKQGPIDSMDISS